MPKHPHQHLLDFAATHDWGHNASLTDAGLRVEEVLYHADGTTKREWKTFTRLSQLFEWAGY